jgi:hypothetical protein
LYRAFGFKYGTHGLKLVVHLPIYILCLNCATIPSRDAGSLLPLNEAAGLMIFPGTNLSRQAAFVLSAKEMKAKLRRK